jgi:hypothetical protein
MTKRKSRRGGFSSKESCCDKINNWLISQVPSVKGRMSHSTNSASKDSRATVSKYNSEVDTDESLPVKSRQANDATEDETDCVCAPVVDTQNRCTVEQFTRDDEEDANANPSKGSLIDPAVAVATKIACKPPATSRRTSQAPLLIRGESMDLAREADNDFQLPAELEDETDAVAGIRRFISAASMTLRQLSSISRNTSKVGVAELEDYEDEDEDNKYDVVEGKV